MPLLDPVAFIPAPEGGNGQPRFITLDTAMANRHGIIAGATGTGKTVTLHALAERLSNQGVTVFLADAKGDLSGLAAPGRPASEGGNAKIDAAIEAAGLSGRPRPGLPATFWDVFGEQGHPLRATVSEMGPLLLGRALGLTEVQSEVLSIIFRIADDRGLLLLDLKDLRAVLEFCSRNASNLEPDYGHMAPATLGAIQRGIVVLEGQGGDRFFGEPALAIGDLLKVDSQGRGFVHVLAATRLLESPSLYAAFMLWLLSELFEELPEAGDLPAPKLVFFFDEAHLLFDGAPPELLRQVARTVRLIRSKGVGVWFVTQNPMDLPEEVLAQLGNRVQHALRAYSEKEQRSLRAAASSFRPNPGLDAEKALGELAVGEALVSFLDEKGVPAPVERARIAPPLSRVGPLSAEERSAVMKASPYAGAYDRLLDRASAWEALRGGSAAGGAAIGGAASGPGRTGCGAAAPGSSGSTAQAGRPGGFGGVQAASGPGAAGPGSLEEQIAAIEAELRGEEPPATARGAEVAMPDFGEPAGRAEGRGADGGAARDGPTGRQGGGRASRGCGPGGQGEAADLLESMARSALRSAGSEMGRQLVRGLLGGLSGPSRRRRRQG
jgi:DNA helicase HerA-like ATPase